MENSKMAFDWIQLKEGLLKKVIQKGNEGKRPRFWSEIMGKVIKFPLGSDQEDSVLLPEENTTENLSLFRIGFGNDEWTRILELCVQLMDEGEVSQFRAKTRNGEWLGFQLYLDEIVSQAPTMPCWDRAEVITVSKQLKEQGISLYRGKRIIDSFYFFGRALKLLIPLEVRLTHELARNPENKDEETIRLKDDITSLVASMYNNLAACQLAVSHDRHVVYLCDQVLERTPTDLKAIYRKASALFGLKQFQDCFDVVKIGLTLDPTNKAIGTLERQVFAACKEQEKTFAQGIKKFFN
ncbi:FK506-binding protein-like [Daphnia carinata]|uniref:FK506-binding protein-like n=1 Tax=Daphnia carinata TaxID=120202 RepID=UPI002579D528|nr:FK506-binding protein-like [Daphnia carinata]